MALQPLMSTALVANVLGNESLHEALNEAEGVESMASVVEYTLYTVEQRGASPLPSAPVAATSGRNRAQSQERVNTFLKNLQELVAWVIEHVNEAIPLVLPVCGYAFYFIELAVMRFLTTPSRATGAMKKVWPAESARIESTLTAVRSQIDGISGAFDEATQVFMQAASSDSVQERNKALRRYEAMKSDIEPVFDTCIPYIRNALAILGTLNPRVKKEVEESKRNAITSSSAIAIVGMGAIALTGAWIFAVPAALLGGACLGMSSLQRRDLRYDLAYYTKETSLIIELESMRNRMTSREACQRRH